MSPDIIMDHIPTAREGLLGQSRERGQSNWECSSPQSWCLKRLSLSYQERTYRTKDLWL